jgi:Putative adhesin
MLINRRTLPQAVLAITLAAPLLSAQQTIRLTPSNGRVAIWNLIGSAHIEAGTSSEVEVVITPRGADAAQMITRTGLINGQQTLRIFYPVYELRAPGMATGRRDGSYSTLNMRDDGRFDGNMSAGRRIKIWGGAQFEASADIVIKVPATVALDLHVALGDIDAAGTRAALSIDSYSGAVRSSGTRGSLTIDTGSGDVEVITHNGDLSVDTGSGDVEVSDVTGARRITLDTGSGAVIANRCQASDKLTIDTGSGEIIARNVDAPEMTIDTGSGAVEVAPNATVETLRIDTGSGQVTLVAPTNFGAQLEISAGSGRVSFDVPLEIVSRDGGDISARLGNGRSRVSIDTGSGGVKLRSRI